MKLPKCQVEEVDVLMRNILELLLTKLSLPTHSINHYNHVFIQLYNMSDPSLGSRFIDNTPLSYDTYSIVIESASLFSSKVICNDTFRQEQMQLVN